MRHSQRFVGVGESNDAFIELGIVGVLGPEAVQIILELEFVDSAVVHVVVLHRRLETEKEKSHSESMVVVLDTVVGGGFILPLNFAVETGTDVDLFFAN